MKKIKDLLVGFLAGVGIGALIEAVISMIIKKNIVGIPEFVASHGVGYAKIIQCLVYGGFGLVSVLMATIFKNENRATYLNQTIHFCAMLGYFIFAGLYLKWFDDGFTIAISAIFFVGIYLLISFAFYISEKNMIEKINKKL
ncbi:MULTISPECIES: DUF3021 domain-containing protein [Streptococcus]|uniref:DUF3021 domain-containing protein n=1 Tax=Streptococcus vaginalis TaxID=2748301 RepID=A0ABS3GBD5_9STRE|nr:MULTISPECIES: DUF3021 domain-containing protein [Streptococcus]MBO0363974.1 DUF3021 domain-containing protein [Streptococcus vaginalis]WEB73996.1 DUF3021 domain-containing protein [Streptococcus anginosus]